MFEVKDKENRTLFIKDKITHTYDKGPDTITVTGIIISFPEEGKVQYQGITNEGKDYGLPTICDSCEVLRVDSLAQRAMHLRTEEEFQKIMADAVERYKAGVSESNTKKAGTRGGTTTPKKQIDSKAKAIAEEMD